MANIVDKSVRCACAVRPRAYVIGGRRAAGGAGRERGRRGSARDGGGGGGKHWRRNAPRVYKRYGLRTTKRQYTAGCL